MPISRSSDDVVPSIVPEQVPELTAEFGSTLWQSGSGPAVQCPGAAEIEDKVL